MTISLRLFPFLFAGLLSHAEAGGIPEGFTPIFNGKDLSGWHLSKTTVHGSAADFRVTHGIITGTQNPASRPLSYAPNAIHGGGVLLTDRRYKNFEVYVEAWADWGCDSGLFLRSSEAGQAYQVTLDYLPGGGLATIYGEGLQGVGGRETPDLSKLTPEQLKEYAAKMARGRGQDLWDKYWKKGEWNSVRARIEGDSPHIQVWVNGEKVTDFQDTANHAAGGATEGSIGLQVHYSGEFNGLKFDRWTDGGFWRWRNVAVKVLPD